MDENKLKKNYNLKEKKKQTQTLSKERTSLKLKKCQDVNLFALFFQ